MSDNRGNKAGKRRRGASSVTVVLNGGTKAPGTPAPRSPSAASRPLAVVGIGASAGGLDALKDFFKAMPAESGMAFVVIQHLEPAHESHMADILAKYTSMMVATARG